MADTSSQYQFQKTRRRPDIPPGGVPVCGFGEDGSYTLWLMPAEVQRTVKFQNGKPTFELSGPTMNDPELQRLRDRVIESISVGKFLSIGVRLSFDLTLAEYAATLILRHYVMTDDELGMLLPVKVNAQWIEPVIVHALGGESNRDALASLQRMKMLTPDESIEGLEIDELPAQDET